MSNQSIESRLPQVREIASFVAPISASQEMQKLIACSELTTYSGETIRTFRYAKQMFGAYFAVLDYFDQLEITDIERIDRVIAASYCEVGVPIGRFISPVEGAKVLKERNISLAVAVRNCLTSNDPLFTSVTQSFACMFNAGCDTKAAAAQRGEPMIPFSDPYWDDILVGQLLVTTPEAMVHFITSHAFSLAVRITCRDLGDERLREVVDNKETVHGIISIVIRVMAARHVANDEIVMSWRTPHVDGGVAWHAKQFNSQNQKINTQTLFNETFG